MNSARAIHQERDSSVLLLEPYAARANATGIALLLRLLLFTVRTLRRLLVLVVAAVVGRRRWESSSLPSLGAGMVVVE